MKRRTFLVCTAALFCGAFLAGGCTQKTSQPVLQQIEYSNLADSDTQALLSKLLQDAGVSDLRIQTFFDHVQKFNNAVDPAWLTTGFENANPLDLKYDPYSMQDAWTEKYDTFPGWNCRITACGLFGDFITVTGKADLDSAEDTLFMDYETLDSDPESLCGDERQKFDALFAPVKTTKTTDIPTHLKTIQQEFIIVTHNANVVLGADAEEVIIANQDGVGTENSERRFEYRSGSIENDLIPKDRNGIPLSGILNQSGIQTQICDILEGGRTAFQLRQNKYIGIS